MLGDEPTGNLDVVNREHVIDALLAYGRSADAAIVVVTHDRELLPRFDRVVDVRRIADPQITRMRTHDDGVRP